MKYNSIDFTPRSEKERARVLEISREKIRGSEESDQHKPKKDSGCNEAFIASNGDGSKSPK